MKKFPGALLPIVFLIALLYASSCTQPTPAVTIRAFYYWKSVYRLSNFEKRILAKSRVTTLYVKMFDVAWDETGKTAMPAAQIQFKDTSYRLFRIIPVVFITNETLLNSDSSGVVAATGNICKLLAAIINKNSLGTPGEIQFDCDWTVTTKEKYFLLLRLARAQLNELGFSAAKISATIRLYQCRYLFKTGVPPVDRGTLMCYNMGNLKNPNTKNSILESNELKKYVSSLDRYPVPLDVAFPLFEWKVLFRNGKYTGLVKELPDSLLLGTVSIIANNNYYTFSKDTVIDNYSFKNGDMLREEQSAYNEIAETGKLINSKLKKTQKQAIILYHLDSLTLSKYTSDEIENMFDCLH